MLGVAAARNQTAKVCRRRTPPVPETHTFSSHRLVHEPGDARVIPAAEFQLRPVVENHRLLARERRTQFPQAIKIHDRRAVDADKARGIQARLEPRHRLAQEVHAAGNVECHVIALGLDPIDLLGLEEKNLARRFEANAVAGGIFLGRTGAFTVGLKLIEQLGQAGIPGIGLAAADLVLRPLRGGGEAGGVRRFQPVIDRIHLEGPRRARRRP